MSRKKKCSKWNTCSAYFLYAALFLKERNQVLTGFHFAVLMNDDAILKFFNARERNVSKVFLLGSSPSRKKIKYKGFE